MGWTWWVFEGREDGEGRVLLRVLETEIAVGFVAKGSRSWFSRRQIQKSGAHYGPAAADTLARKNFVFVIRYGLSSGTDS